MTRALRWIVCSLLIVLAALSSAASVVALFVHTQVNDTDSYVETVAPLASDPAVQAAVADRLTEELTRRLDGFPQVLTRPAENLVREVAFTLVSSDQFATLWTGVNRQAHAQLAAAVTGQATDGIVRADNTGTVTVSLEPVMTELRTRLRDRGFTLVDRLPAFDPQFDILQSDELVHAQRWSNALDRAALWLPWAAAICAVSAVAIAPKRMRALSLVGLATAVAMLALLATLTVVRRTYLQDQDIPSPAAAVAVYDTLATSLVNSIRVLLACGVAVAVVGYVAGSSHSATSIRSRISGRVGKSQDHLGKLDL
ncbi:hypothetical protein [Rhodococcus sp. ARC_M6]|uniref:hypothetical protein n=1 Tax=Rhodococcus sp. ARC_M6 TaxID=2928852 RepID=UPI001FB40A3D|nr:hypothetical protein [Rhodococcus sp. ARC_M6]MCJ0906870.1 hypothetical protein [Rhodococcus sp. ARC_M6]